MARKSKETLRREHQKEIIRWITIVVLLALIIVGLLKAGIVGVFIYNLLKFAFGDLFWIVLLIFAVWTLMALIGARQEGEYSNYGAIILLVCAFLIFCTLAVTPSDKTGMQVFLSYVEDLPRYFNGTYADNCGGGVFGALLYGLSSLLFDRIGAILVGLVLIIIAGLLLVSLDVYKRFFANIAAFFRKPDDGNRDDSDDDDEEREQANLWQLLAKTKSAVHFGDIKADDEEETDTATTILTTKDGGQVKLKRKDLYHDHDVINHYEADGSTDTLDILNVSVLPTDAAASEKTMGIPARQETVFIDVGDLCDNVRAHDETEEILTAPTREKPESSGLTDDLSEEAPHTESLTVSPVSQATSSPKSNKSYRLPGYNLLDPAPTDNPYKENEARAKENSELLIQILKNFDIEAELQDIHIGPSVTQYEVKPAAGIKVSRILSLTDNIKMQLAAKDIRIEAPIPGHNAVGIEVPNAISVPVRMRELISKSPAKDKKAGLIVFVGKDLQGNVVTCRLDQMPHLLIAGATGSGKSICMNAIIISLLLRTKPDEVKMLLIDPKKVEFTNYQRIPHLIGPVINDAAKASNALKVIVRIMDERYEAFAKAGVRNISAYNDKVKAQGSRPNEDGSPAPKPIPYIIVIIDELADLMVVAGKEVEASVQRITQLARAAGIHLIVATQRPSTDVITGIIKANIPSRIAFSVSSGIDSRTILDHVGAERLLGNGDMLYAPIGQSSPSRLQGVFVSDEEVKRITDYCVEQAVPMYDDAFVLLDDIDAGAGFNGSDGGTFDPLYEEVKEYVVDVRKASTSLLQRRFGIGYNRAARMIDMLEQSGVIGPAQGSKPREVYAEKED